MHRPPGKTGAKWDHLVEDRPHLRREARSTKTVYPVLQDRHRDDKIGLATFHSVKSSRPPPLIAPQVSAWLLCSQCMHCFAPGLVSELFHLEITHAFIMAP